MEGDPFALVEAMTIAALRHRRASTATSTSAASTRSRSGALSTRSSRPASAASSARTSWARGFALRHRAAQAAPAPTSAARRPRSSTRSRASAASRATSRRSRVDRPVRQADRGQQRGDAGQRAPDRARRRAGVRADRHRGLDGPEAVLRVRVAWTRPGMYEVPFGATLRELIELAGGVAGGRPASAVLLGGAAGSFVRPDDLDMPLTFEDTRAAGATLGSGVVAGARRHRRPRRSAAAHRRVLPRRVLRPVRALPGRHGAPGGSARAACVRPAARSGSGRAGPARRHRRGDARRVDLRARPDRLVRDRVRRSSALASSTGGSTVHDRAPDGPHAAGSAADHAHDRRPARSRCPRARRSSTRAAARASTRRRCATARP